MKIRIEFNNDEKYAITEACECPITEDESETIEGRFGSIVYDHEENFIECNFEPGYIKAYTNIISMAFNMMKSLAKAFEVFIDAWASDAKITKGNKSDDTSKPDEQFEKEGAGNPETSDTINE